MSPMLLTLTLTMIFVLRIVVLDFVTAYIILFAIIDP